MRGTGDQFGKGRFPGAGWSPENDRANFVGLDRFTKRRPLADDFLLSNEFIERPRTHPVGQWPMTFVRFFALRVYLFVEQVHTDKILGEPERDNDKM